MAKKFKDGRRTAACKTDRRKHDIGLIVSVLIVLALLFFLLSS